jgi:hypothetical protein
LPPDKRILGDKLIGWSEGKESNVVEQWWEFHHAPSNQPLLALQYLATGDTEWFTSDGVLE